jgi:hypothetical protein
MDLDKLEEELLKEEDDAAVGCGAVLAGSWICGKHSHLCYKCNHGDGEDPRLPKHLRMDVL